MNPLHEDVIVDLLPLYFGGDASSASRALVDAYFQAHPAFAASARAAHGANTPIPAPSTSDGASEPITRIRSHLRWRAICMAIAIFCTISPFSFIYDGNELRYFMWRDAPALALLYSAGAIAAWLALLALSRRINRT